MLVELKNISKSFGGNPVLKDVSVTIQPGSIHALVGENGAGKSTLMKILIGVENPDQGEIFLNGQIKRWNNPLEARLAGIAMVYQELSLVPTLTVYENIFLGKLLHKRPRLVAWKKMKLEVQNIFREIDFSIDINRTVQELSIAEQQMVEIARALTQNAQLIILDEPTSSLTEQDTKKLFSRMKALKEKGVSFIFITHRLQEVFEIADDISILRDGELVKSCSSSDLDVDSVVRLMVGRELREQFPQRKVFQHSSKPVVLQVENLSQPPNFYDISFKLHQGEILGFAGLMGAGRTELMEAIFGVKKPVSGMIEVNGHLVKITSPTEAVRTGLGLIADDRKTKGLVTEAEVLFNLVMATQFKFATRWGWRLKGLEKKSASDLISQLRIKVSSLQQPVLNLSGGNQQKVAIGKTLNTDSSILIFDEPTRGIDVGAKREIYFLIRELADRGASILLVSSEMEELLGLCDRILVMHQGHITGALPVENATQEKIMKLAVGVV